MKCHSIPPTAPPHTRILWGVMSVPVLHFEASSSHLHNPGWSTMRRLFWQTVTGAWGNGREKNLKEMLLDMDRRSLSSHVMLVSPATGFSPVWTTTKTFNIWLTVLMFLLHKNNPQNTCSVSNSFSKGMTINRLEQGACPSLNNPFSLDCYWLYYSLDKPIFSLWEEGLSRSCVLFISRYLPSLGFCLSNFEGLEAAWSLLCL